jgi:hypothetical protein
MKPKLQLLEPVQMLASGDKSMLDSPRNVSLATLTARPLSLSHALRIQSARYWLRLGETDQALRELEALPRRAWLHPLAAEARVAALRAAGQTDALVHE